jgi:SHAQKYF class myb-like DNA-binding protein
MPRVSSNSRRTTSSQKMEDNEPYLDLTYGAGGEQEYVDQDDGGDDDDDDGDDNYYYDEVQQQPQAPHGFVSGTSMFQQSNNPFDDPFTTSTTTNLGMNGEADDDADADMSNNFEVDNDEDMEEDPNSMNRNNHHEELFHYEHTQQPPPPPPSQSLSQGSHSASGVEEHTGRWTKEEHEAFLQGLKMYGKEWKKVAAKVRTRTVVQTRTHAQKYFQKLQKSIQDNVSNKRRAGVSSSHSTEYGDDMRDGQYAHDDETQRMIAIMNSNNSLNDDDNEEEDGFAGSAVLSTASTSTRGRTSTGSTSTRGRGGRRGAATNNTSSGLKAALSKKGFGQTQPQPLLPPPPVTAMNIMKNNIGVATINQTPSHQLRRGSTATLNAAQVISTLSSAKTGINNLTAMTSRIPTQLEAGSTSNSQSIIHSTPSRVDHKNYFTSNNSTTSASNSNMKIVAPDPSRMGRHYAFPEPSPAATGKRKLAEIAAAQMLAGVISSSSKVSTSSSSINMNTNYNPNTLNTAKIEDGNPIDFSMSDGPPTPPMSTSSFIRNSMSEQQHEPQQRPLDLNEAPPLPPLFSSSKNNSINNNKPSLHIVNPDLFGIVPSIHRSNDPVTPWENDLAALVDSTTTNPINGFDEDEIDVNELLNTAMNVLDTDNTTFQSQTSNQEEDELHQLPRQQQQEQQQYIHPILGPVDGYSRTPLHQAICAQDVETVQTLLDVIGTQSKDLNQYDTAGYTPLHSACAAAMATTINGSSEDDEENNHINDEGEECNIKPNHLVRMLLQAGCNPYLYDSDGNTPLHWSVRACDYDATQQLIQHIISTTKISKDSNEKSIDTKSSSTSPTDIPTIELYLNVQNQFGETCMHWAARGGIRCCDPIAALLLAHSASTGIRNKSLKLPIDVAADGYFDEPYSVEYIRNKQKTSIKASKPTSNGDGHSKKKSCDTNKELTDAIQTTLQDRCVTRAFLMYHSKPLRTLVLHHPECLDHHPKSISDWETPDRVRTILQRLENSASSIQLPEQNTSKSNKEINMHEIVLSQEFDRGNLELLSRVHSTEYLSFVNQLSKDLERKLATQGNHSTFNDNDGVSEDTRSKNNITKWGLQISSSSLPVVPFTPMVQRTMIKVDESNVKLSDNSDTSFSVGSLRAARRAAGAVQHAIDWYVYYIRSKFVIYNVNFCSLLIDVFFILL